MLKAAATAGAVAWVAPSVLTVDRAFAVGSCGTGGTLNWNSVATGAPGPSSVVVAGVTVAITHTDPNAVGSNPDFQVVSGSFGGQTNRWYQLQIVNAATGDLQTVTFTFSTEVNNLAFTLFDIDQNTTTAPPGRYRDVVSITARNALSSAIAFTPSALGANVVGAGTAASPFTAQLGTDNITDGSGNATVTFNAPVKTVTITYSAAAPRRANGSSYNGAPWDSQRIGIGNLSWNGCT